MKIDIHDFARRLSRTESLIRSADIAKKEKRYIRDFENQLFADGLGMPRVVKYLQSIRALEKLTPCPICEANARQITSLLARIERSSWSSWTKHDYKLALRMYLRFLGRKGLAELVHIKNVHGYKLPEELITPDDIFDLMDAQGRIEDHAFLFVLYESGCRIGELLSLQRKHVVFDSIGAVLVVDGKTGMRRIRLIESAPVLDEWISCRSFRQEQRIFPNTYRAYAKRIKEMAARAGIQKRIYPHLFRHSRATYLASFLTEAQLCTYMGWSIGSAMPRIYVHLAGHDLDQALMKVPAVLQTSKEVMLRKTSIPT